MDFLDPKKRRAHRIKLYIGYALMAIALTFASVILLYQAYGYDIDPKTRQIVQNGMVFVSAHPVGADVYVNGESKGRTDVRLDIKAGDYTLELRNPGYRDWKRSFTLEGGSIEQFAYPFLFPTELKTADTQVYSQNPAMVTQSLDRKWVLVQQPGQYQQFDLIDVGAVPAKISAISLPSGLLTTTGTTHTLETVEWSSDNKRVVLKHTYETGSEFVVVDVEAPAASSNITRAFSTPFTSLTLKDKKYDKYYLYNQANHNLYTANLKDGTVELFQSAVLAFQPHGNEEVVLVTDAGAPAGKVLVKIREGDNSYTIRELKAGSKYLVDLARFDDSWYVAAGVADEEKIYLFKNPVAMLKADAKRTVLPIAVLRTPDAPDFISFSTNARFLASQSGSHFAVYDAETDRQYRYDSGLQLATNQKVSWMDGHRLATVAQGKTIVFDYDRTNQHELTTALDGYTPLFDRDYEALFTFSASIKGDGRPALARTELRVQ